MARITRRLKVYTTRIGIRDWVIAAANQKEALKAWDVRENLFASGAARETNDPGAIELAMQSPGVPVALPGKLRVPDEPRTERRAREDRGNAAEPATVIRLDEHRKRARGANVVDLETRRKEKHRAEETRRDAEEDGARRRGKGRRKGKGEDRERQPQLPLPTPPPDRSKLDAAEEALAEFEKEAKERRKELDKKKRALDLELEAFESETRRQRERLEKRIDKERTIFESS